MRSMNDGTKERIFTNLKEIQEMKLLGEKVEIASTSQRILDSE